MEENLFFWLIKTEVIGKCGKLKRDLFIVCMFSVRISFRKHIQFLPTKNETKIFVMGQSKYEYGFNMWFRCFKSTQDQNMIWTWRLWNMFACKRYHQLLHEKYKTVNSRLCFPFVWCIYFLYYSTYKICWKWNRLETNSQNIFSSCSHFHKWKQSRPLSPSGKSWVNKGPLQAILKSKKLIFLGADRHGAPCCKSWHFTESTMNYSDTPLPHRHSLFGWGGGRLELYFGADPVEGGCVSAAFLP